MIISTMQKKDGFDATNTNKYNFKSLAFKSNEKTTEEMLKQFLILSTLDKKDSNVVYDKISNEKSLYLNPTINALNYISTTSEFGNQQNKYSEIHDIANESAWEYIKSSNFELIEPLWSYLYNIKLYLQQKEKFYRLSIYLDENIDEPDFKILAMFIETNIANLDEEILLINEIGEIFDNTTSEILLMKGEKFNDKLAPIIYFMGEINYGYASIRV